MLREPTSELEAFRAYIDEAISTDSNISPEECLKEWRATVQAIQEGLEDVVAGRTQSLEEFDRQFRTEHNIDSNG